MTLLSPPANTLAELWRENRAATPVVQESSDGVHTGYQKDPVRWQVEQLGIPEHTIRWSLNPGYKGHKWDGTPDPIVAALEGLANNEWVGVEAGTGTQKTYNLGAAGMLWFLACWENAIVITLAPKEDQLSLHLWKEARKLFPAFKLRFPQAKLTDLKLRLRGGLDEAWTATGFVCGVGADEEAAGKARGFHAEHALYIFEESPGVHHAIGAAIDFTCTAPHNLQLRLGNPDNEQDELHKFCKRKGVRHVRISALDHPNVVTGNASIVPGAASVQSVERLREEYGEGSSAFNAKVRGIAPKESADSLIRWSWCEEAAKRYGDERFRVGLRALGCDVANSPKGDQVAIAQGIGACLLEVDSFKIGERGIDDAGELGTHLALLMAADDIDEYHVGVDPVGVGAATVNEMKRLKITLRDLNGGLAPVGGIDEDLQREEGIAVVGVEVFGDLRTQMYWLMRQDLQKGRVAFPYDEELFRDLTTPKWIRRNGKIVVEPKESSSTNKGASAAKNWGVKDRLGRSTDKGDAVVYWNFVRHRSALPSTGKQASAFSKEQLEHDARESRRIRPPKPAVDRRVPPESVEHID